MSKILSREPQIIDPQVNIESTNTFYELIPGEQSVKQDVIQPQIHVTVNAADKIAELITEEQNPKLNLRIFITGGGCSGFQYGFTFDENIQHDDTIVEQQAEKYPLTIKLLVDVMSYQYLQGAQIDFRSGLNEEFVISNPNAKTTCGCGSSFNIDDDE